MNQEHLDDIVDVEDRTVNSIVRSSQNSEEAVIQQEKQNIRHLHMVTLPLYEPLSSRIYNSGALEEFNYLFYDYFKVNTGSQCFETSSYVVEKGLCSDPEELDSFFEIGSVVLNLWYHTIEYRVQSDDSFKSAMLQAKETSTDEDLKFYAIAVLQARIIDVCIDTFRVVFGEAVQYHGPTSLSDIVDTLVSTRRKGGYFTIAVNYL